MKKFAIICASMCGLSCGVIGDKEIEPDLYATAQLAQEEIDDMASEGVGVEDWDVEQVTVDGDIVTIVETGQTFNWRDGV